MDAALAVRAALPNSKTDYAKHPRKGSDARTKDILKTPFGL